MENVDIFVCFSRKSVDEVQTTGSLSPLVGDDANTSSVSKRLWCCFGAPLCGSLGGSSGPWTLFFACSSVLSAFVMVLCVLCI